MRLAGSVLLTTWRGFFRESGPKRIGYPDGRDGCCTPHASIHRTLSLFLSFLP